MEQYKFIWFGDKEPPKEISGATKNYSYIIDSYDKNSKKGTLHSVRKFSESSSILSLPICLVDYKYIPLEDTISALL